MPTTTTATTTPTATNRRRGGGDNNNDGGSGGDDGRVAQSDYSDGIGGGDYGNGVAPTFAGPLAPPPVRLRPPPPSAPSASSRIYGQTTTTTRVAAHSQNGGDVSSAAVAPAMFTKTQLRPSTIEGKSPPVGGGAAGAFSIPAEGGIFEGVCRSSMRLFFHHWKALFSECFLHRHQHQQHRRGSGECGGSSGNGGGSGGGEAPSVDHGNGTVKGYPADLPSSLQRVSDVFHWYVHLHDATLSDKCTHQLLAMVQTTFGTLITALHAVAGTEALRLANEDNITAFQISLRVQASIVHPHPEPGGATFHAVAVSSSNVVPTSGDTATAAETAAAVQADPAPPPPRGVMKRVFEVRGFASANGPKQEVVGVCVGCVDHLHDVLPQLLFGDDLDRQWKAQWDELVEVVKGHGAALDLAADVVDLDGAGTGLKENDVKDLEDFLRDVFRALCFFANGTLVEPRRGNHASWLTCLNDGPATATCLNDERSKIVLDLENLKASLDSEHGACVGDMEALEQELQATQAAALREAQSTVGLLQSLRPVEFEAAWQQHYHALHTFDTQCRRLFGARRRVTTVLEVNAYKKEVLDPFLHFLKDLNAILAMFRVELLSARERQSREHVTMPGSPISLILMRWVSCTKHLLTVRKTYLRLCIVQLRRRLEELDMQRQLHSAGGDVAEEELFQLELGLEHIKNQWSVNWRALSTSLACTKWLQEKLGIFGGKSAAGAGAATVMEALASEPSTPESGGDLADGGTHNKNIPVSVASSVDADTNTVVKTVAIETAALKKWRDGSKTSFECVDDHVTLALPSAAPTPASVSASSEPDPLAPPPKRFVSASDANIARTKIASLVEKSVLEESPTSGTTPVEDKPTTAAPVEDELMASTRMGSGQLVELTGAADTGQEPPRVSASAAVASDVAMEVEETTSAAAAVMAVVAAPATAADGSTSNKTPELSAADVEMDGGNNGSATASTAVFVTTSTPATSPGTAHQPQVKDTDSLMERPEARARPDQDEGKGSLQSERDHDPDATLSPKSSCNDGDTAMPMSVSDGGKDDAVVDREGGDQVPLLKKSRHVSPPPSPQLSSGSMKAGASERQGKTTLPNPGKTKAARRHSGPAAAAGLSFGQLLGEMGPLLEVKTEVEALLAEWRGLLGEGHFGLAGDVDNTNGGTSPCSAPAATSSPLALEMACPRVCGDSPLSTLVLTHHQCRLHDMQKGSDIPLETPRRLEQVMKHLTGVTGQSGGAIQILETIPRIGEKEILLCHSKEYFQKVRDKVDNIDNLSHKTPLSDIGGDTFVGTHSMSAALFAVSVVCAAVDRVMRGECQNAFCAVRPPGHHAGRNGLESLALEKQFGQGFCIFNNIAIGTRYAMQQHPDVQRVVVLDWDVHHGNGTQEIFENDDSVLFISMHQAVCRNERKQSVEYPGTGMDFESRETLVNVPFSSDAADAAYLASFDRDVQPVIDAFKPDLILISAGFDAHEMDPIGYLKLTTQCFVDLTSRVMALAERHCEGRLVSVLEVLLTTNCRTIVATLPTVSSRSVIVGSRATTP
jgi:acetoin utilization deacetylase AcuC-like enzyme